MVVPGGGFAAETHCPAAMTQSWHALHAVTSFELVGPYTLRVRFDDSSEQLIDFEPMLVGELYGPLRDPAFFARVRIDADVRTLVWPNGADFDPATLHDWPAHSAAMFEAADRWRRALH